MYGDFFLLEGDDGTVSKAERLAFGDTAGRNEAWLRDTLLEHPELLPIREVDPAFVPLVPLCRELRTGAGSLDLAFINGHGRLTLVECKLWRNPEARRKVVAQVLDYARAIKTWSYSDLQRQVSAATGRKGNVPFECVREQVPDLDEARFIDDTFSAMRDGRFLLLIAGDGIRKDVGAMAEMLNRNAASGFSFGLIEVAMYGFENGSIAVQPRVVAKTQIIERTVVVIQDQEDARLVDTDHNDPASAAAATRLGESNALEESPKQAEYRRFWSPVLEMQFDDPDQDSPRLHFPNNVRAALPWPGTWVLAYRSARLGKIGISIAGRSGSGDDLLERLGAYQTEILESLPEGSEHALFENGEGWTFKIDREFSSFESEGAQQRWAVDNVNAFINVFRPWADRALRESKGLSD